ncbi:MAG: carbon-nitrogen hydrolase family protein [Anaerolineae bacterium]|nr:carbon-nitrogen hydrolase family protein [Anaerolineae bacterium]
MTILRVALLQLAAHGAHQTANRDKGTDACRQAAAMHADIALFPEMWNIGYTFFDRDTPGAHAAWAAQAISADDDFVTHFQALARDLNMAIAITYLETWPGSPRNTVALIGRHGDIALTYAKVHTCDFDLESALTPGDDFYVCTLDTVRGEVRVGAMICMDREFPESARILMLKGAEIILIPNACDMETNRTGQLQTRAYENMTGVALANYADARMNGHSVAFDGIAFTRDEKSRNTLVIEAGEREGVFLAEFDIHLLREYRQREIWGNAFRKPSCYGLLTAPDVAPPFVRASARR